MGNLTKQTSNEIINEFIKAIADIKDEYLPDTIDDFALLKKCIDAIESNSFSAQNYQELRSIANGKLVWRLFKEIYSGSDYSFMIDR